MTDIKNSSSNHSAARSSRLATASNDAVVGLDHDLLAVKEKLCGESSSLRVIPIVGMGGIGKTTLARNAYHDQAIRECFHIGGWVTVTQSSSLEEIISRLQQSLKHFDDFYESAAEKMLEESEAVKKESGAVKKESGAEEVYKALCGRKYIVVMDDIWSTSVWDDLKYLFPIDKKGSRVILTTRLLDVATYVDHDCRPHEMQLMHEDQSWDLLKQKVAMKGDFSHELEEIGKAIARSCGGLPLAIVVVAGLLSAVDRTRASWEEIAEKVNSTIAAKDGQLEKMLSLSYTDLPRHLRQCLVYMGGFPEDHEICVEKLTKLWIAEGFIDATSASKSLEEEAEECLRDLIKRSVVFVGTWKLRGEIKSCSLHDLMWDFCKKKADEDKFPLYDSFRADTREDIKDLRVVTDGKFYWTQNLFWLSSLRYLVLDCSVELPAAVSNLENLQTLIIHTSGGLVRLPREIWRMQQLRHLVSSFDQLPCPRGQGAPATCFPLANLQTLSKARNLECSHGFVKMFPNIKKLGLVYSPSQHLNQVYHLHNFVERHEFETGYDHPWDYDYRLKNLRWLNKLEKLKVRVYHGFQGKLDPVFPQSLRRLSLSGWRVTSWREMTIFGSLPNLQVLKLRDFGSQDEKWETTEGEFARLSFLLMERCDLQEWITESEHFPRLKWLLINYCWQLQEIPTDIGNIPTLEVIEVTQCSASLLESARCIDQEQKEMGNDSLEVRCI